MTLQCNIVVSAHFTPKVKLPHPLVINTRYLKILPHYRISLLVHNPESAFESKDGRLFVASSYTRATSHSFRIYKHKFKWETIYYQL